MNWKPSMTLAEVEEAITEFGLERFLNIGDVRLLYRLARELKPGCKILEVGTNAGRSTKAMSAAAPECVIMTVDIANLWRGYMPDNVIRIVESSSTFAEKCTAEFDLIFIDGDHSQFNVQLDIAAWLPKLRPGGIVVFHDYRQGDHPGVNAAIDSQVAGNLDYERMAIEDNENETVCYVAKKR